MTEMPMTRGDGFVIWFTGLSGAGKTTLAQMLAEELRLRGRTVEVLDGDVVRTHLSKGLGFSKEDRDENIRRIGFVCSLLARHGVIAIAAAISPYRGTRDEVRAMCDGRFVEIYIKCPLEVAQARDVKGLYRKALAGEISHFTGISAPYEEPTSPEAVIQTDLETPAESLHRIVDTLEQLAFIGAPQFAR